jgi:hypothetical protein
MVYVCPKLDRLIHCIPRLIFIFFPGYPLLVIVQILLILVFCLKKLFVSVFSYCHFFLECCHSIIIILDKFLLLAVSLFYFRFIWIWLDWGPLVQFRMFSSYPHRPITPSNWISGVFSVYSRCIAFIPLLY